MVSAPVALYWTCGLLLALAGGVLLAWSLLGDRSRGRRRCPRCWYDLSAAPQPGLTCSECGYTARHARGLLRTRRRWRWAGAALLLWLACAGLLLWPKVQRDGWGWLAPTLVLLVAYNNSAWPWHDDAAALLADRVREQSLRNIEWSIFERINSANPQYANNIRITLPARWPPNEPVPYSVELNQRYVLPPGVGRQGFFDTRRIGLSVIADMPGAAAFEGHVVLHPRFSEVRSADGPDRMLGHLPPGAHALRFAIELHLDLPGERQATIWTGEQTASIEITRLADEELVDLAEWFRRSLTLQMRRRELDYSRRGSEWQQPSELIDIAMAGRLELYWNDILIRIDDVVIMQHIQVVNREVLRRGPLMADFLDPANATWRVRLTSDPVVAFNRVHEPRGYWQGTIEFPLKWDEQHRQLVAE